MGPLYLGGGNHELCQGWVPGSETQYYKSSEVSLLTYLCSDWGACVYSVWLRDFSKAVIMAHSMKYVLSSSLVRTHHTHILACTSETMKYEAVLGRPV